MRHKWEGYPEPLELWRDSRHKWEGYPEPLELWRDSRHKWEGCPEPLELWRDMSLGQVKAYRICGVSSRMTSL